MEKHTQGDTPRTDAESEHVPGCGVAEGAHRGPCDCADHQLVSADFARQLERELSTARARIEVLEGALRMIATQKREGDIPQQVVRMQRVARTALKGES